MNNNNKYGPDVELLIARGITKQPTRDGSKQITKLFLDAETMTKVVEQIQAALASAEDGVSLTLLEGEGKKGPYGMISFKGLEKRQEGEAAYNGPKKAYTPREQAPQAVAPQVQSGYKPKSPGYAKPYGNK